MNERAAPAQQLLFHRLFCLLPVREQRGEEEEEEADPASKLRGRGGGGGGADPLLLLLPLPSSSPLPALPSPSLFAITARSLLSAARINCGPVID